MTIAVRIPAYTCRSRNHTAFCLRAADMRSHRPGVGLSFLGALNESRFKSGRNLFAKFCKSGCRTWSFTSPVQEIKLASVLNITFIPALSILILIDYLPAEVYTEIFPLSSLSLGHLFILSMSIINTVTLPVAAVTLFRCSCCQVNFLECFVVTSTKILWDIGKVLFHAAVFDFFFSGNWPVLSLGVLFENKMRREAHRVCTVGFVSKVDAKTLKYFGLNSRRWICCSPGSVGAHKGLGRQKVSDPCVNSDLLRSVFQPGRVAVIRWGVWGSCVLPDCDCCKT